MFKSIGELAQDVMKTISAPVEIAADVMKVVSKPVADVAETIKEGIKETLEDD